MSDAEKRAAKLYPPEDGPIPGIDRNAEARLAFVRGAAEAAKMYDEILVRQGELLRTTVNALRGAPPEDTTWSVHDIAEQALGLVDSLATITRTLVEERELEHVREEKAAEVAPARQPEQMWLNAMSCVRPSEEFLAKVGGDVHRLLMQGMTRDTNPSELPPWRETTIRIVAS